VPTRLDSKKLADVAKISKRRPGKKKERKKRYVRDVPKVKRYEIFFSKIFKRKMYLLVSLLTTPVERWTLRTRNRNIKYTFGSQLKNHRRRRRREPINQNHHDVNERRRKENQNRDTVGGRSDRKQSQFS
jgi:hypothetical protein